MDVVTLMYGQQSSDSNTLYGSADKHCNDSTSHAADDRADSEQDESDHDHRFVPECGRKGCKDWLKDCARKDKAGAEPV